SRPPFPIPSIEHPAASSVPAKRQLIGQFFSDFITPSPTTQSEHSSKSHWQYPAGGADLSLDRALRDVALARNEPSEARSRCQIQADGAAANRPTGGERRGLFTKKR